MPPSEFPRLLHALHALRLNICSPRRVGATPRPASTRCRSPGEVEGCSKPVHARGFVTRTTRGGGRSDVSPGAIDVRSR